LEFAKRRILKHVQVEWGGARHRCEETNKRKLGKYNETTKSIVDA